MSKPQITLSINPTYFCNFDCSFCYLTPSQLNDKEKLSLEKLQFMLEEVKAYYDIVCIDIYGGEVSLLGDFYLETLLSFFGADVHINVITNLSFIPSIVLNERVNLSVSWEGDIRRKYEQVWQNMIDVEKDINLLMLVSPEMLTWKDSYLEEVIMKINNNSNIKTVELKPYSTNQSNNFSIRETDFENMVKKWFSYSRNFTFINEENLKAVFTGTRNSFSDDHLYITPQGKYAVLDFKEDGCEFFKLINSLDEYILWTNTEKVEVSQNSYCSKCEFFGNCLSEHLRTVTSLEHSCNGYYKLIEWYRRYELS